MIEITPLNIPSSAQPIQGLESTKTSQGAKKVTENKHPHTGIVEKFANACKNLIQRFFRRTMTIQTRHVVGNMAFSKYAEWMDKKSSQTHTPSKADVVKTPAEEEKHISTITK